MFYALASCVVAIVVAGIVAWLIGRAPIIDPPAKSVAQWIVYVIAGLWCIFVLLGLVGVVAPLWPGSARPHRVVVVR